MSGKGYLPHAVVKGVVFWTLALCILSSTAAGILHAWELIGNEWVARWVMSSFILSCGSLSFLFVNCLFGEMGAGLFSPTLPPPNIDPAFGERLRKAKGLQDGEKGKMAG